MSRDNPLNLGPAFNSLYGTPKSRSRNTLTLRQKIYVWDHAKALGVSKTCRVCGESIKKFEDVEFDHTRAHIKGGVRQALTHRWCNRMKSSGSLGKIQRIIGKRTKGKKKTSKATKRKSSEYGYVRNALGERYRVRKDSMAYRFRM